MSYQEKHPDEMLTEVQRNSPDSAAAVADRPVTHQM
jgi:hypothetical protein